MTGLAAAGGDVAPIGELAGTEVTPGAGAMGTVEAGGGIAPAGEFSVLGTWVVAGGGATALDVDAGVAGVGTKVIVFGTFVMIPGFADTCGAQIPAR